MIAFEMVEMLEDSGIDYWNVDEASTPELTRNPGMIRSQLIGVAENLDWELFCRELMSYLPSATLRDFTEHLREQADIDDLLMFE